MTSCALAGSCLSTTASSAVQCCLALKIDEELGLKIEKVQRQEMRSAILHTASMTTAKKGPRVKPDADADSETESSSASSDNRPKKAKKLVSESERAMTDLFESVKANSRSVRIRSSS